jgi:hypothetical protein
MLSKEEQEEILRKALFIPCDTKEHLHKWIKIYLGIDVPNVIVCDDEVRNPSSNSSPMDLIWEIYSKARNGQDETFTRVLGFAARDSFKTLSAAILETLCMFHLGRNVGHMAALEAQANNCQRYIEGYFKRPILREFMTSKNKRQIEITRYLSMDGSRSISPAEFNKLTDHEKKNYEEKVSWIKIVIATVGGANGLHAPFFVCVSDQSEILIKNNSIKNKRDRIPAKAGVIFNRLMGFSPNIKNKLEGFTKNVQENIEVLSFNYKNGLFEFKPIIATRRSFKKVFKISLESGKNLVCTENHPIMTLNGYKEVKDLNIGDGVLRIYKTQSMAKKQLLPIVSDIKIKYKEPISDCFEQTLIGSLLGDAGVYRGQTSNSCFKEQHSYAQKDYLDWKLNKLSQKLKFTQNKTAKSGYTQKLLYGFYSNNSKELFKICKKYIHPTMMYKFDISPQKECRFCKKQYYPAMLGKSAVTCGNQMCVAAQSKSIKVDIIKSIEPMGEDWVIDFTVKDNHNFIANGVLVKNCDELDLSEPAAYDESKMIPSMGDDGQLPITFLTSTRKYSFGLVQQEIDASHRTGLNIRHWNIIDVTERCPPKRHLPEEPQIPIYFSENNLRAISKAEHDLLSEKEKAQWDVKMGYKGCLQNCKLFAQCKGRLATKQTSDSKLLKKINHVQPLFSTISVDLARAQLMCYLPSSEGKIYPNFQREKHLLSAADMARRATGEEFPDHLNKAELIEIFKRMGAEFYCGLDWGFTHNFAVVTAALLGHTLYIIDVISAKGLELQQRIELCKEKLTPLNPAIYPDNAYPSDVKSFRMAGFRMINFKKEVQLGIENARKRIMPGNGLPPSVFLLKEDPGCEFLATKIVGYHWKIDPQGNLTDEPDSQDDDELDAFRYLCQNVPLNKSKAVMVFNDNNKIYQRDPNEGWIQKKAGIDASDGEVKVTGKPGGLLFSI